MSSVGSSDGSNNTKRDDAVRRNREEYQSQSSEQTKKHQKELRRINEQHYAEVEKLKSNHIAQMQSMGKESKDSISERDHKYQREMEDLRAMHRKQVQHLADESARKEDSVKKATTADSSFHRKNTDARFEKLGEDYIKQLHEKESLYQESLKGNREAQERALYDNRKHQEAYHQREVDSIKNERNSSVNSLQKQYKDYRENAEGRLKSQEVKHMQEQQNGSNDLVRAVKRERALRVESENILRDGFSDGLQDTRERFENAMKKDRAARDTAIGNMKASAVDRVESQVRRLELEKEDLKENKIRNELQLKQKQNRELANMRDAFQDNVNNLAEQRDEAVHQFNDRNRKDVLEVRKDMGKQLVDTNRFYRERMEESNRINRDAYETIKDDFDGRNAQTKNNADQRIQRIHGETEETKARMIEKQAADHEVYQQTKQDEMKKIRALVDGEKNAAVRRAHDQMRKQELQHTEKMANMVSKYEKQITTLKDQMMRQHKQAEENLKRTVEEMTRMHHVAMDQVDSKNKDQMRQAQMVHGEQMRQVSKRHEEKIDQVITEVKKG
jgi:hypothetical protein